MNVTTPFWITDPNWLEAIGTIGAVIVALLLAGGSFIWRHFKRPILEVAFDNTEPYCRTTHEPAAGTSYFIRLKITNIGKSTARHCVGKINRIIDPITLKDQENWDPVALQWVGHREGPIHINRGEYEFLELVTIRSDGGIYLREPRGIYRITLPYIPMKDYLFFVSIYGENFVHKPIIYKFISNREFDKVKLKKLITIVRALSSVKRLGNNIFYIFFCKVHYISLLRARWNSSWKTANNPIFTVSGRDYLVNW